MLFLKYLDDLEAERALQAELNGKPYTPIIDAPYRWAAWAAPRKADGSFDHDKALTGADLIEFVDRQLFPYLMGFKGRAESPDTIEYKIGEIFAEITNRFRSGYSLRDALELIDGLRFRSPGREARAEPPVRSQDQEHGQRRAQRRRILHAAAADPRDDRRWSNRSIGEKIYDGACGSAGFLCEANDYLREHAKLSTSDLKTLQERTFYGKEKKSPRLCHRGHEHDPARHRGAQHLHTNTLAENLGDIQEPRIAMT
jgi:type I restriction enzyme M protein